MSLAAVSVPGSGRRKAAVALVALGAERAAALLKAMHESEVRTIVAEVSVLGPVTPDEVGAALAELNSGLTAVTTLPAPGTKFARDLLIRTLGAERGEAMAAELEDPGPFMWLGDVNPDYVADTLAAEPPAAVALALVHLPAQIASRLLTQLPEPMRYDVVTRIASLKSVHPDTVAEVDACMRARVGTATVVETISVTGTSMLAEMLTTTSRNHERALLHALAAAAPELAELVKASLFTFEDVADLEARALQTVLKAVDTRELAMALKNANEATLGKILTNLSERAREDLLEEIDLLTTIRPVDITQARQSVVATCRRLEDEGTITIARPDDDD